MTPQSPNQNTRGHHPIEVRLPERLPSVLMDAIWIKKVLHICWKMPLIFRARLAIFISSE